MVLPENCSEEAAVEFKQEFFDQGEFVIPGSGLLDQLDYQDWLQHTQNNRSEANCQTEWVPATTFFVRRKSDQKIIGIIDIRHHIDHPFLRSYAGHIGYAIRPTERRKGYASEMLKLGLAYAESLGLAEVMLGCHADNLGSSKTIEKNGGLLTEEKTDETGERVLIYWIQLKRPKE